jgi:hypothetical protein
MLSPDRNTWVEENENPAERALVWPVLGPQRNGYTSPPPSNIVQTEATTETDVRGISPRLRATLRPEAIQPSSSNADVAGIFRRLSRRARRSQQIPLIPIQERFWLLHKWQGQVLAVDAESFQVQLFDPSEPELIEKATFQKTEMSPENLRYLRPGATFYWFVGFRDLPNGVRKRESEIWIKRGGRMDKEKYAHELTEVRKLWGAIEWSKPELSAG